jgi:spermidine synthase
MSSCRFELAADPDQTAAWTLLVDGFPQSHVDLEDARHLEFEYVRRLGHMLDLAAPAGAPLRVLHLGAGALTLARYVAATRRGSRQLAVDSDAALVEFVRRRLPLGQTARRSGIRVRVADARAALAGLRPGSFDVVVADLFAAGRTPPHLTSAEFAAEAAQPLAPHGIFAANITDGPPLSHARARVAAIRSVFASACLISDAGVLRGRRFGNLVVAASRRDLPVADLVRRAASDPFPGRVVYGTDLDRFVAGVKPMADASAEPSPPPPPDLFAAAAGRGSPPETSAQVWRPRTPEPD